MQHSITTKADGQPLLFDVGSFRDRSGRVFESNGEIFRAFTQEGLSNWKFVSSLPFVQSGMRSGTIVGTELQSLFPNLEQLGGTLSGVLHHDRIPLITYPYEWSFSMLRAAALLQLELMLLAVESDAIFKDATPFNIQFQGTRPTFIDTPSIVPLKPGGLWEGYRQFCQMFLYPLMLQAYRGVDFQPFLRGRLDGISPQQFNSIISLRDMFRKGVLAHVFLHSKLGRSKEPASTARIDDSLRESGFQKDLIENNVRGLIKLIEKLNWNPKLSRWSNYDSDSEPVSLDAEAKESFVKEVCASNHWSQTWDIGCNLGRYSRIAAQHSDVVVALDSDHLTVDRLFLALQSEGISNITPLIYDPADPSPNMGWRCQERIRFAERGKPDLILCLAVIHHLVFSNNLLLHDLIDWLAEQNAAIVIEFVDRLDPQVQSLLANREDVFSDYSREAFEACISLRFDILKMLQLPSRTRTLMFVTPRI